MRSFIQIFISVALVPSGNCTSGDSEQSFLETLGLDDEEREYLSEWILELDEDELVKESASKKRTGVVQEIPSSYEVMMVRVEVILLDAVREKFIVPDAVILEKITAELPGVTLSVSDVKAIKVKYCSPAKTEIWIHQYIFNKAMNFDLHEAEAMAREILNDPRSSETN